jgi:hypothetical protein
MAMTHVKRLLRRLCWAVSFCIAVVPCVAQEKGTMQSSSASETAASPSSENSRVEVAPGLVLPEKGMVWILDQADNQPKLERIYLNDGRLNRHLAENVVRSQLLVFRMSTGIELKGTAAKLRVSSKTPAVFIHKSKEDEEESQSPANAKGVHAHYALLRLRIADDSRVICTFTSWQLGIKAGRHEDVMGVLTEELNGQWLKITPKGALPDGEFVITRLPDDKKLFESHVYDFGIGTAAKQATDH